MPQILLPGRALLSLALAAAVVGCDAAAPSQSVRYTVDGPATITYATPGAVGQATTSGSWEATVALSGDTPAFVTATSTTGAPVTAQLFKDDDLVGARRGREVRVEAAPSSSSGAGEIEVKGPIEALTADRVTVLGIAFALDGQTRLEDDDDRTVPLSAFAAGTYVEVEGRRQGDGSFRATKMELEDDRDDSGSGTGSGVEIEVEGTITALDDASMTVGGRRFTTSESTRYLDDDGNAVARSAFRVGERVEAEGWPQSDGSVRAKKIKKDDD